MGFDLRIFRARNKGPTAGGTGRKDTYDPPMKPGTDLISKSPDGGHCPRPTWASAPASSIWRLADRGVESGEKSGRLLSGRCYRCVSRDLIGCCSGDSMFRTAADFVGPKRGTARPIHVLSIGLYKRGSTAFFPQIYLGVKECHEMPGAPHAVRFRYIRPLCAQPLISGAPSVSGPL